MPEGPQEGSAIPRDRKPDEEKSEWKNIWCQRVPGILHALRWRPPPSLLHPSALCFHKHLPHSITPQHGGNLASRGRILIGGRGGGRSVAVEACEAVAAVAPSAAATPLLRRRECGHCGGVAMRLILTPLTPAPLPACLAKGE